MRWRVARSPRRRWSLRCSPNSHVRAA